MRCASLGPADVVQRAARPRLGYPRTVIRRRASEMVTRGARLLMPRRMPGKQRLREFLFALCVPLLLMTIGTTGYMRIEHWRFLESLYMTVITITTVGFGEVHPLHSEGRGFTLALALVGVFTLLYAATALL